MTLNLVFFLFCWGVLFGLRIGYFFSVFGRLFGLFFVFLLGRELQGPFQQVCFCLKL